MGEVNNKHYTVERLYLCNEITRKNVIINVIMLITIYFIIYISNTQSIVFSIALIIR